MTVATAPSRPVLRYHGGKWRLAPWIVSHLPPHQVYVEPFAGGASVLLRKTRSMAEVYNDLDGEIVNVFRVLRDPPAAARLRELCYLTPWSRDEFWAAYEPSSDPVEQARRTIFRCFAAHGTTSRRAHRTGFRAKAYRQRASEPEVWARWPAIVPDVVERLRGCIIENRPARECIAQHDGPATLFYIDPPYVPDARSSLRWPSEIGRAYVHDSTAEDHRALAAQLERLEGMVVLSGYRCPLYEELFGEWQSFDRAALADGGVQRTETLWLNPAASRRRAQLHLEDQPC